MSLITHLTSLNVCQHANDMAALLSWVLQWVLQLTRACKLNFPSGLGVSSSHFNSPS